MFSPLI